MIRIKKTLAKYLQSNTFSRLTDQYGKRQEVEGFCRMHVRYKVNEQAEEVIRHPADSKQDSYQHQDPSNLPPTCHDSLCLLFAYLKARRRNKFLFTKKAIMISE